MLGVPASNLCGSSVVGRLLEGDRDGSCRRRPGTAASRRGAARASVEHADAGRAEHLVAGERVEVAAERLHVDAAGAAPPARRRAEPECPSRVRQLHDLLDGIDRAERVRDVRDGDDLRALAQEARRSRRQSARRSSSIGATTSFAPVSSHSICHGTMFEWCSMCVIRISSPAADVLPPVGLRRRG